MPIFTFIDVVSVLDAAQQHNISLSFIVLGDPLVQARPKITWKARSMPTYYDPSNTTKNIWRRMLHDELLSLGITTYPVFVSSPTLTSGVTLRVNFFLPRRLADYRRVNGLSVLRPDCQLFPPAKDVDNMLKFLMDAMDKLIYANDTVVVKIVVEKHFIPEGAPLRGAYTEIYVDSFY